LGVACPRPSSCPLYSPVPLTHPYPSYSTLVHPTSNGSWQWLGCFGWQVLSSSSPLPLLVHLHPVPTPQAVACGGGAGCWSLVFVGVLLCSCHLPGGGGGVVAPLVVVWPWCIRIPPDEQWLVSVGVAAPSFIIITLSPVPLPASLFHPLSTPQAVAHEAGGGWCITSSPAHCCNIVKT